MSKIKIKCFNNSYHKFNSKEDIFRDESNYPVCADCFIEYLQDYWDDEFAEYIFNEIKNKFNRNYNKWQKWFFENHTICDGESEMHNDYDDYYEHNDNITVIDGKNYCSLCIDELKEYTDFKEDKKNDN